MFNGLGLLTGLIVGAIAGWLAGKFMNNEGSLLRNIILGVVGGFDYSFYYTEAAKSDGLCSNNTSQGAGMSAEEALEVVAVKYPEIIDKLNGGEVENKIFTGDY